jgi:hypothetical protein
MKIYLSMTTLTFSAINSLNLYSSLIELKYYLSPKALKTLYFSLVHPHLVYCVNIYSCTSQTNFNRITKLQKKAIRIISNSDSSAHTEPLFHSQGILSLNQLVKQAKLHLMHSIVSNYCPESLSNIFLTNATRDNGHLLRNDSEFYHPTTQN